MRAWGICGRIIQFTQHVLFYFILFLYIAVCRPSFTVIPNNGNTIYVNKGASSLTLAWDYNTDGRTVDTVLLVYIEGSRDVIIAGKRPN